MHAVGICGQIKVEAGIDTGGGLIAAYKVDCTQDGASHKLS